MLCLTRPEGSCFAEGQKVPGEAVGDETVRELQLSARHAQFER